MFSLAKKKLVIFWYQVGIPSVLYNPKIRESIYAVFALPMSIHGYWTQSRGEKPWDSPGKKLRIFQFLLRHTFDPKVGIKFIAVRIV